MKKRKLIFIIILLIIIGIIVIFRQTQENKKRQYSVEQITEYKYFQLYENNKMGVINTNGQTIIEPIYDSIQIPNPSKDIFICLYDYNAQTEEYKTKVLNEKNEEIYTKFQNVTSIPLNGIASEIPYEKNVLMFEKNGKYGVINFDGKVVVKPIYDEIQSLTYKEGELLVKKDNKCGVVNTKGAIIIKPEYDTIVADNYYIEQEKYKFSGYIVSKKIDENYNYGYIKYDGKILLKPEYTNISRIIDIEDNENIYLIAQNKSKTGLIKNKEVLVDFNYKELQYNKENNILLAKKNAKLGILNLQGQEILPLKYDDLSINGEYVYTKNEDEEKYFDIKGNEIQDNTYKNIYNIDNGKYYLTIDENSLYGILDRNKQVLVENTYSYLEYLFDDYFIASNNDLGIINSNGEVVLDFKYNIISNIENSNVVQAKIVKDNTVEVFSKELKSIGIFEDANIKQKENYIEVNSKNNTTYLDLNGKILESTEVFKNNNLFSIEENGKYGFKDKNGNIVVNCIYDEVTEFNEYGFAGIKQDGKWGVIDQNKNIILEPTYEFENESTKPFFINKYYRIFYGYGSIYYTTKE